jgi:spore coat protein A
MFPRVSTETFPQAVSGLMVAFIQGLRSRPSPGSALLDEKPWNDPVSENPTFGTTEVWSFLNLTVDSHPIHLHAVHFRVLDRQAFDADRYNRSKEVIPLGPQRLPEPWEMGPKDTVCAHPNEITRILVRFESFPGRFVWHCHMLEHEDFEMMRPYTVLGTPN